MSEFSTYLCVGAINFLVCILTMLFLSKLGVHYIIYTAMGYGFAIFCSFFLNLKFTFKAGEFTKEMFLKFITINITNLFIVEIIQITLIKHFKTPELSAIIIGMFWYTLTGYLINKFFVYKSL